VAYYLASISVPPEEPRIFDAQGKEISQMAGPFREGYELFLCCQVRGGKLSVSSCRLCLSGSFSLAACWKILF